MKMLRAEDHLQNYYNFLKEKNKLKIMLVKRGECAKN